MEIQRTNPAQSAAGALLAALDKGDKAEGVTFQREFSDSLDAIAPRRRASGRQDQPIEADARRERPKADQPRDAQTGNRRTRDAVADTPVDAALAADPATTTTPPTPQADDPSRRSEAASVDPAAEAAQQTVSAETPDEAPPPAEAVASQTVSGETPGGAGAAAQESSQNQGAHTLLKALETASALTLPVTPAGDSDAESGDGVIEETATRQVGQTSSEASSLVAEVVGELAEADSALATGAEAGTPTEAATQAGGVQARRATVQGQGADAASLRVAAGPATSEPAGFGGDAETNGGQTPVQSGASVPQVRAEAVSLNLVASSATTEAGPSQSDDAALRVSPVIQGTGSAERIGSAPQAGESSVDQSEQIDRIARVMRASISRGGSRVSLQLEPRDIGPLRVQMHLRGSELVARFETQSAAARHLIEQGMQQLRQGLAAGGIQLVDAAVETRAPQNQTLGGNGQGLAQQEQADAGQGGGQNTETSQRESHSDHLPWAEMPAGEDALDIMA